MLRLSFRQDLKEPATHVLCTYAPTSGQKKKMMYFIVEEYVGS